MAYEIINSGPVTPYRLHALIRLLYQLEEIPRKEIVDLLQPIDLGLENQETAKDVIKSAIACGLVIEIPSTNSIRLNPEVPNIETVTDFKLWMQKNLLGHTEENEPNFLLNIFTAWYLVQNEGLFQYVKDVDKQFNAEVFPDDNERSFNSTKLNSWKTWASFLGFGWLNRENGVLIPDVHDRIEPQLSVLLPNRKQDFTFSKFFNELGEACPELDGGRLYRKCLQFSRKTDIYRNRLSLALSTALRVLNKEGKIEIISRADASENWQLFPASGYKVDRITHIRLGDKTI